MSIDIRTRMIGGPVGIRIKIHLNPITKARVDCHIEENAGLALLSKHHLTESDFLASVITV